MGTTTRRTRTRWGRPAAVAAVLGLLLAWVGTGPFLHGLRAVDAPTVAAAAAIAVVTTVCAAWRWAVVARGFGVDLAMHSAVPAYYRSQFLNLALPGGVLGDVHRAASHGVAVGDLGAAARAVVWERVLGQAVQVGVVLVLLAAVPGPLRGGAAVAALTAAVAVGLAVLGARASSRSAWAVLARPSGAVAAGLRTAVGSRRAGAAVVVASTVAVAGHAATFLLAARAVGVPAGPARVLPVALLLLLVMAVPLHVGGWGPREGAAAWLFAVAGWGADGGVAAATAYGVLAAAASLPGAAVLLHGVVRERRAAPAAPVGSVATGGPVAPGGPIRTLGSVALVPAPRLDEVDDAGRGAPQPGRSG